MTMKKQLILMTALALSSAMIFTGCGDDDDDGTTTTPVDMGGTDMVTNPDMTTDPDMAMNPDMGGDREPRGMENPPAIGTQIDRTGRPGITTALVGTFNTDEDARNEIKDTYNGDADPSSWVAQYTDDIAASLAILDGLDAECGNQLGYAIGNTYGTIAGALANDRLWVNSTETMCGNYLAVELSAIAAMENLGCGGRLPSTDVIDITYSALAAGSIDPVVGDGVDADDKPVDESTFPFLAAP